MLKKLILVFLTVNLALVSAVHANISDEEIFNTYRSLSESKNYYFTDLDSVPWAVTPIETLAKLGIVSGMSPGIFEPQKNVSKAEFIKLIISTCGLEKPDALCTFGNVGKSHWAYSYIASAQEAGLTDIYDTDKFLPDEPINREDICYMSMKALDVSGCAGTEPSDFKMNFDDEDNMSLYAKDYIYRLAARNVINGRGNGDFSPKDSATRAEAAKIIYNVLNLIQENY